MLALLAALHIAAAAQNAPAPESAPPPSEAPATGEAAPPSQPAQPAPGEAQPAPGEDHAAGEPRREEQPAKPPATPEESPGFSRQLAERTPHAEPSASAGPRPIPSLLSAEPLRGGSTSLGWVGWTSLGAAYGQGITQTDDLGAKLDFDWTTTELRLGAFYRRPLGTAGPWRMAGRLGVSWYSDFGATWIRSENHADRGVEVSPGLTFSVRGAGGVFSVLGEAPITVTLMHDGGLLFSPKLSVAYETPLYDPVTIGVRTGIGYRAGSGDAPLSSGKASFEFLVLAGYRLF
jgi:hypothetical protein